MSKIKRLPDAELEIMNALWDADAPLTAAELETALPGPPRARTTLLTLLARLEEKGCVTPICINPVRIFTSKFLCTFIH